MSPSSNPITPLSLASVSPPFVAKAMLKGPAIAMVESMIEKTISMEMNLSFNLKFPFFCLDRYIINLSP